MSCTPLWRKIWRDEPHRSRRRRLPRRINLSSANGISAHAPIERHCAGKRHCGDAWDLSESVLTLSLLRTICSGRPRLGDAGARSERLDSTPAVNPGFDAPRAWKVRNHQPGADQQHERQRHLPQPGAASRATAPCFGWLCARILRRAADRARPAHLITGIRPKIMTRKYGGAESEAAGRADRSRVSFKRGRLAGPMPMRSRSPHKRARRRRLRRSGRAVSFPRATRRLSCTCWRRAPREPQAPVTALGSDGNRRFATLAQAISSTRLMVPINTQSALPVSPTTSCFSGRRAGLSRLSTRTLPGGGGQACDPDLKIRSRSAFACANVTPGFSRATP